MNWRKWQTIKSKILVSFIVLLIIPMSLIAVINYLKSASILEVKAREQFQYLSEGTNQQFTQYMKNLDTLSMNIVEAPVIQKRLMQPFVPPVEWTTKQIEQESEVKKFLAGIHKLTPGLAGIAVFGYNGIVDYTHPDRNFVAEFDYVQEEWFKKAAARNGSWVLSGRRVEREFSSYQSPGEVEVVTFARVINSLNSLRPMGVLAINMKISEFEAILGIADRERYVVILDEEGRTILSTNGAEDRLRDEGWLQSSSLSPVTGWTSIHLTSKEELFKESKNIRSFIIMLTILLSACAVVLAQLLSSGIVRPLQTLKDKMQQIEKGQFQGEITLVHRDEVGELTQRFNRMMVRMKSLLEENRYREQQKAQLEMDALQARINPHFLYNTLMALRIQAVTDGNRKLGELIASLVHLLKFSAKNKRKMIKLRDELELISQYVKLMQLRNENFDFRLEVEPDLSEHLVFPFLLQPIVENAVFHGIGPLHRRGTIRVTLHKSSGQIVAVVEDDGVGMDRTASRKLLEAGEEAEGGDHYHKIGVRNVYERLKRQFGEAADIQVESRPQAGTKVSVRWPVLKEGDESHEGAAG
ncbi:sensor histidine kinase [Cohnella sp. LGH]|uniref:sensor histidine kinase n=1 Tax=Cohnella sp. LGH TaxID=1619153 RepID=UPI001AD9894A|nr:sensor histidine kinase [Cohnella sp. LGH]QTH42694.1 sensor histidine kinase [Cohnella sp. LGH]